MKGKEKHKRTNLVIGRLLYFERRGIIVHRDWCERTRSMWDGVGGFRRGIEYTRTVVVWVGRKGRQGRGKENV